MFSLEQKKTLLALARSALTSHFEQHRLSLPSDEAFQPKRGVFVSLHMGDELRGCIGYIKGYKSIASSVVEMAEAAAFRDPRFVPLGLFISHPYGSGLLLPQVAVEWKWDARTFLREVCRKAGLNSGAYKDADSKVYRFTADVFSEKDTF
jgi:AMMECR1 domain-containing protein